MGMKISEWIDRIASIGAIITAFSLSCCLPLFAIAGATFGLSFLQSESSIIPIILQALYVSAIFGGILTYKKHKNILPLIFIITGNLFVFYAYHFTFFSAYIYTALISLVSGSILNFFANRKCGCK